MSDPATAEIIPFPRPHRGREMASSLERLSQALASLSGALSEQRDAMIRWRGALHDLAERCEQVPVAKGDVRLD